MQLFLALVVQAEYWWHASYDVDHDYQHIVTLWVAVHSDTLDEYLIIYIGKKMRTTLHSGPVALYRHTCGPYRD